MKDYLDDSEDDHPEDQNWDDEDDTPGSDKAKFVRWCGSYAVVISVMIGKHISSLWR